MTNKGIYTQIVDIHITKGKSKAARFAATMTYVLTLIDYINHHLFADDTQLYVSLKPEDLSHICSLQCLSFHIQLGVCKPAGLNPTKTEFLLIGWPQQLSKLASYYEQNNLNKSLLLL